MKLAVIVAAVMATTIATASLTSAYAQEVVRGTFVVRMPPGSYQEGADVYYDPTNIAVPAGTTVVWFNDDPNQIHTVTSGNPGDEDAGSVFDSSFMNDGTFFQQTFNEAGEYPYYCQVHPWMVGSVFVSDASEEGDNFRLSYGTGTTFNFAEHERTLLVFEPTSVDIPEDEPVTYQITILKDGEEMFSEEFRSLGGRLDIELIPTDEATQVTGPDISDPIIGAYHIHGSFLKEEAAYTIRAEITQIFDRPPEEPIADEFGVQIVPEFPVAAVAALLAIGGAVAYGRFQGFSNRG
ncbi:plastocyanin/azurin family copper-binding protein [Nitrososphaera sp.]|uniref:cupredoxin domain-containing protein n=1 Tax=Nitrososphaera sp. TaxID=1971748 RepID=UPI0017B3A355|nr:plastocyanin/azurin family copper-binding protein [Nitrososphaera sp.]NWG37713.1 hypothetical protein [Nitrososphaera sp.]